MGIRDYRDRGTRDVAGGDPSKFARRIVPVELHKVARVKLAILAAARSLDDLRARRGLNLHALVQDRAGQHAIRINDQFRICFFWTETGVTDVEITDYH